MVEHAIKNNQFLIVGPKTTRRELLRYNYLNHVHINHHWLDMGGRIDGLFHKGGREIKTLLSHKEIQKCKFIIEGKPCRWHHSKTTYLENYCRLNNIPYLAIDRTPPKDKTNDAPETPYFYTSVRALYAHEKAQKIFSGLLLIYLLAHPLKAKLVRVTGMDLYKDNPYQGMSMEFNKRVVRRLATLKNVILNRELLSYL